MSKLFGSLLILFMWINANAVEMGVPVQLKFKDPTGVYPDASNVLITVQILSPSNGCVLREEDFTQDIVSGTISVNLGTGSRAGVDPNIALTAVYDNSSAKNNLTCVDINDTPVSTNQTYNPVATDTRVLRIRTTINGTPLLADFIQRSTPYAIHAESVGGKVAADILVKNGATSLNQANLEALLANGTKLSKLQNIADNGVADTATTAVTATNATNFTGNLAGDTTGTMSATVVARLRGVTLSATAPTSGQIIGYNGSQYLPVTLTASLIPGAITSATPLLGDVTGNASATVVSSVGGKTSTVIATTVNAVNSATALATPNMIAKRDGSGNLAVVGLTATAASLQQLNIFEGTSTNFVNIKAPNSFSNYVLTLPTDDGNSGDVLQTDGSGNLSWVAGVGGSVTSASIIAALGYTPADDAELVVGTTAGTLAAGDDSRITGALQQTAYNAYVASAECNAGQTMYWNSVSSTFLCQDIIVSGDLTGPISAATVTKIQGIGVSFSALGMNHLMQFDGSNFINHPIPSCANGEYITFDGAAWTCGADAGGGASVVSISTTAPISSTGGSNPNIFMPQATSSQHGYLSSGDWTVFNNKISGTSAAVIAALGYTPASSTVLVNYPLKANNLSDLASATVARVNLGLSAAATMNVGTTAGTLAAGDDARITGALQQSAFNTYVSSAGCSSGQSMYWNSVSSTFLCQNIVVSGDISGIVSSVTVTKVQGVGVSITALAGNHLLQYNGTQFVNRAIPTCAANQYLTFNGTAWSCTTDVGSAGVVTNVSSTNAYITVATSSTTPALTLNVGTSAGTVAAGNDTRITNALQTTTLFNGDVSGTYNAITLNATGVIASTYTKVTVDTKGRVTSGTPLVASDIPVLDASKITTGQLPITLGGTGAATSATALSNIGAARRGANDDITSFVNSIIFSAAGTGLTVSNNAAVSGNLTVAGDISVVGVMSGTARNAVIQNAPTTAGSITAYTISYGTAADAKITTNNIGDTVRFKVNAVNSGTATLKVAGAPAANIFSAFTGAAIGTGDLQIGYVDATFDGTNWVANIPPRRVAVTGLNLTGDSVQTVAAAGVRAGDSVSCSLTQTGALSTINNWVYAVAPTTDAIRVILDENGTAGPVAGITCIIQK